jgi:crotonobetainyl-CoA:carnitine CoA-transferase CaiB-like acyl-CoA transferase
MSPILETTPGSTEWPGPDLGAHTNEVLTGLLNLSQEKVDEYHKLGITFGK